MSIHAMSDDDFEEFDRDMELGCSMEEYRAWISMIADDPDNYDEDIPDHAFDDRPDDCDIPDSAFDL